MFGQLVLSCIPISSTNSSAASGTPRPGTTARRAYEPLSRQRLPDTGGTGTADYEDWGDTNEDYGSVGGGRAYNPTMFAPTRQPTEQEVEAVTVSAWTQSATVNLITF